MESAQPTIKNIAIMLWASAAKNYFPQRQTGVTFRLQFGQKHVRGLFVQPGLVLNPAQGPVSAGCRVADAGGQQTGVFSAL